MTPLAILLLLQEALPPPPEPTGAPDINTAQVIGIVILSLGLIVLAALAVRPLVGRKSRDWSPDPEPILPEEAAPAPTEQNAQRPIIQFPGPATRTPESTTEWHESNPVIEERFGRVLGEPASRRKLGDRRPTRRAHDLAVAALHRLDTEPHPRNGDRGTAVADRPFVPIDERRLGVVERIPQGQILQWQGSIAPDPTVAGPPSATTEQDARNEERSDTGLEHSFANRPSNYQGPSDPSRSPGATEGDDATQEFIVANRKLYVAVPVAAGVTDLDYGRDIDGVDTNTLAEISQVLRDLIYCANSGELFHGFALYSDPYLFRFMDGTGLTEDEFRDVYGSIGSRPKEDWERLDRLSDVVRLPDGKVEATVSYVDVAGKPINGRERFRFAFDPERGVWMIDDIAALEDPT